MYRNLAFINGILLAVMIFFNGLVSKITGPYLGTLIYHVTGLLLVAGIAAWKKNRLPRVSNQSPLLLLPGILSVVTILLNNITMPQLGLTLATGMALFGQLVMSSLVEHFGLFSREANPLRKEKLIGLGIISLGILVMILW